jgi:glycosyltransferase involved in cell wall biosynthesis
VLAAIDPGTEVPRILAASGAGVAVAPEDPDAFVAALEELLEDPERAAAMGRAGRAWVTGAASPASVAARYEQLVGDLQAARAPRRARWSGRLRR